MTKYTHIQEDIHTGKGTQGTLLIPRTIFSRLIPEYSKRLLPRELCAVMAGPAQVKGSSLDLNLEDVNYMDVRPVAPGAEIPMDDPSWSNLNILPVKYGARVNIFREMIEDSQFNLLGNALATLGRRFAENETSLMITQLDSAANTVSGGATLTVANITRMMQHLEDADAEPTDFIVGMEVANDLRNIDSFFEADKSGGISALNSNFVGVVYGNIRVWRVSTNAGMTTTTSYMLDRAQALACVEKRPISVKNYSIETHDTEGVSLTQRIAFKNIRSTAVAKATTS